MGAEMSQNARQAGGQQPMEYGRTVFSLQNQQQQRWTPVYERQALLQRWFCKYTGGKDTEGQALCLFRAVPEAQADTGGPHVMYGDIIVLKANVDEGQCLKPTATNFVVFAGSEPRIGAARNGEHCFRVRSGNGVKADGTYVLLGDAIVLESCEKPGCIVKQEGGYIKLSRNQGQQHPPEAFLFVCPPPQNLNIKSTPASTRQDEIAGKIVTSAAPHVQKAAQQRYQKNPEKMFSDAKTAAKIGGKLKGNKMATKVGTGLMKAAFKGATKAAK